MASAYEFPFQDPDLPLDARVDDLVGRMTVAEKAAPLRAERNALISSTVRPFSMAASRLLASNRQTRSETLMA